MMSITSLSIVCVVAIATGTFAYPLDDNRANDTAKGEFQPVSLPPDFSSYDLNADGYIDLKELATVSATTHDDARKPFVDADEDDDDQISPSEFERAPWSLQGNLNGDIISEEDKNEDQDEDSDNEEGGLLDGADDDMIVEVGEPVVEEGNEDEENVKIESDEAPIEVSEDNEEPIEEEDEEARNLDDDEEEEGKMEDDDESEERYDEDENLDDDDDKYIDDEVDPLLDDDLLREETVLREDEFVENAID